MEQPITVERIERALNRLAEIIIQLGDDGPRLLPIYERLEQELAAYQHKNDMMSAVRARAKRLRDQKAATPS